MLSDALLLAALGMGFVCVFLLVLIAVIRLIGLVVRLPLLAEVQPTDVPADMSVAGVPAQPALRAAISAATLHHARHHNR